MQQFLKIFHFNYSIEGAFLRLFCLSFQIKFKGKPKEKQLLNSFFSKIIQLRVVKEDFKGDYRKVVKSVIGTKKENKFIEEMEDVTDEIVDFLDTQKNIKNNVDLMKALHNDDLKEALTSVKSITSDFSETARNDEDRKLPLNLIDKAIKNLGAIDLRVIKNLSPNEKKNID